MGNRKVTMNSQDLPYNISHSLPERLVSAGPAESTNRATRIIAGTSNAPVTVNQLAALRLRLSHSTNPRTAAIRGRGQSNNLRQTSRFSAAVSCPYTEGVSIS